MTLILGVILVVHMTVTLVDGFVNLRRAPCVCVYTFLLRFLRYHTFMAAKDAAGWETGESMKQEDEVRLTLTNDGEN